MNMYERYAIRDIFIGREKGGRYVPVLIHDKKSTKKDLSTDEVWDNFCFGRGKHISYFLADNVKPNQIYMSKIMQDAVKLMGQACWNKDIFKNLWDIAYNNGITTREDLLHMIREVNMQLDNDRIKAKQCEKCHDDSMNF